MRRKSMKSMSDVNVRTDVRSKFRERGFFVLTTPFFSSTSVHSILILISTGFRPPSDVTSSSWMSSAYCGISNAEAKTSRPNGVRRLSS